MKKLTQFLFLLFTVAALSSCFNNCIDGSGKVISEKRTVKQFTGIEFNGSGTLYITKSQSCSVDINADDNILSYIETSVSGDKLIIFEHKCFKSFGQFEYHIGINQLGSITLSGSGTISGKDTFRTEEAKIIIDGSGTVDLVLIADEISTDLSGSGVIKLAGKAQNQRIDISGSGEVSSFGLITSETDINLSGSGKCQVFATDKLSASLTGSGDIEYKGSPKKRNTKAKGSGTIKEITD